MKLSILDQICLVLAIITLILFVDLAFTSVHAQTFEDQVKICNYKQVCQVVNIDDYMTRQKANQLNYNFANDLDTFDDISQNRQDYHEDIMIELDNICRDQYFQFCFGTSWESLRTALN